jgi:hypothetical protein
MSSNLNLNNINYQDNLRSKPIRQNFTDIENNYNALRSEVNASIASTASEITSARDGFDALQDNIHARSIYGNGVSTGGVITASGSNSIYVSTGAGICPNGVGVSWDGATSNTLSSITKERYVVAVINSDNTLSLELGATADDPFYPAITRTQRPIGTFLQATGSPVVINQSDVIDARRQGALGNNKWFFLIQDAVNSISDTIGGLIEVGAGKYVEDVNLTDKNNLIINFESNADIYRVNATASCIKSVNTAGSISENLEINGGSLFGNNATGSVPLLDFDYNDKYIINGMIFNGNGSALNTYKNFDVNSCNDFVMKNIRTYNSTGDTTDKNYRFKNSKDFLFDNTSRRVRNGLDLFEETQIYVNL